MKSTKKAQAVKEKLQDFINYFEKAKHRKPEVIHVTAKDLEALGLKENATFKGIRLERVA